MIQEPIFNIAFGIAGIDIQGRIVFPVKKRFHRLQQAARLRLVFVAAAERLAYFEDFPVHNIVKRLQKRRFAHVDFFQKAGGGTEKPGYLDDGAVKL